jgi:hypothetical protein
LPRCSQVRHARADPGDFNDEPSDASAIGHLQASSELDRVVGATNQITKFETEVATYRGDDTWLYNACWKFLATRLDSPSASVRAARNSPSSADRPTKPPPVAATPPVLIRRM